MGTEIVLNQEVQKQLIDAAFSTRDLTAIDWLIQKGCDFRMVDMNHLVYGIAKNLNDEESLNFLSQLESKYHVKLQDVLLKDNAEENANHFLTCFASWRKYKTINWLLDQGFEANSLNALILIVRNMNASNVKVSTPIIEKILDLKLTSMVSVTAEEKSLIKSMMCDLDTFFLYLRTDFKESILLYPVVKELYEKCAILGCSSGKGSLERIAERGSLNHLEFMLKHNKTGADYLWGKYFNQNIVDKKCATIKLGVMLLSSGLSVQHVNVNQEYTQKVVQAWNRKEQRDLILSAKEAKREHHIRLSHKSARPRM